MIIKPAISETTVLVQNKWTKEVNFRKKMDTSSTLNIPDRLMPFLNEKAGTASQLTWYLRQLLNRYRYICYSGALPSYEGIKTKFQEKGQGMNKRSFRPKNDDWAELKLIAAMHGMTATFFFVILIELDSADDTPDVMRAAMAGVDPTDFLGHPISLTQTLRRFESKVKKTSRFGCNMLQFRQIVYEFI